MARRPVARRDAGFGGDVAGDVVGVGDAFAAFLAAFFGALLFGADPFAVEPTTFFFDDADDALFFAAAMPCIVGPKLNPCSKTALDSVPSVMLDPSSPAANINAFVKVRASLEPDDVVAWFSGNVYGFVPGVGHRHLYKLEGFNIGRARRVEDGYDFLSREVVFYKDPVTDAILQQVENPYTGVVDEVLHMWNDPVNDGFRLNGPRGPWTLKPEIWGDVVHFAADMFVLYPNPLPPRRSLRESGGEMYEGAELVRFIASRDAVEDDSPSAPCEISSVRIGPWLPWMLMGSRPGNLVYHTGGKKLVGGYGALPADLRSNVEAHRPEYAFAPTSLVTPNETSWAFYAKEREPVK